MKRLRYLIVAPVVYLLTGVAPFAADPPHLVLRATYATGLVGDNAEVISIRHRDAMAAISNTVGSVDVIDLSDPLNPTLVIRVPIDTTTGAPNSVAVHPQHDYFLVVTGRAGVVGTVAAHRLVDGALLASARVGRPGFWTRTARLACVRTAVSPSSSATWSFPVGCRATL